MEILINYFNMAKVTVNLNNKILLTILFINAVSTKTAVFNKMYIPTCETNISSTVIATYAVSQELGSWGLGYCTALCNFHSGCSRLALEVNVIIGGTENGYGNICNLLEIGSTGCLNNSPEDYQSILFGKSCDKDDIFCTNCTLHDTISTTTQTDCSVYKYLGYNTSGVYTVHIGSADVDVYCDMETDGGGWTVLQRRMDGSVDFYRNWNDYQDGFGSLSGEFWLGNGKLSDLTDQEIYELRIELEDFDNDTRFATYSTFSIDRDDNYRLSLGTYTGGDAGDSLSGHNENQWATYDHGGNTACAVSYQGAWWYHDCHISNLNGVYGDTAYGVGINWGSFRGHFYSLKFTEMKIRPTCYNFQ